MTWFLTWWRESPVEMAACLAAGLFVFIAIGVTVKMAREVAALERDRRNAEDWTHEGGGETWLR